MSETYVLELIGISKSFPGVLALRDVTIRVRPGEVHALVGENGAGKSTLLKVMFGVIPPDAGKILMDGKEISPDNPSHAQRLGISLVHQELQQIPELNVAQNIFLARELTYKGGVIVNRGRSFREAQNLLHRIGMDLNVKAQIKNLSIAERQMVEIAKALLGQARVIAFDEPTSSLTNVEIDTLFEVIRELKTQGVGIIYVSHRLEEIMQIADRVTVLRDGQLVGEAPIQAIDQATIVRMMVNKQILEDRKVGTTFEVPSPSKHYKVGALVKFLGNPFWYLLAKGMREECEKYNLFFDVRTAQSESDRRGQLAAMEGMLEEGFDALLISPQTDTNLISAVERARARSLLLVNVNDAVLADAEHFVGPNQFECGVRAANYFIKMCPGGGSVAVIEGQAGVYATEQRTRGFKDTLPSTKFKVVASVSGEWDYQKSQEVAASILKQYPDLIGFYCNNDVMALGVVEAVKAANLLGKVIVIGNDGISPAYNSIRANEITGTVDLFPEQIGKVAVRVAISLLEGQKVPRNVYTPQNLITLHNINQPLDLPYGERVQAALVQEEVSKRAPLEVGIVEEAVQPVSEDLVSVEEVLRVVNLRSKKLKGVSFSLYKGELLGISGLVGSGRTETVRAIYGADPAEGEVYIRGKKVHIHSPEDAVKKGIGFLPEDRKASGLLPLLSVKMNISLASLPKMALLGFLNLSEITKESERYVESLHIQPPYLDRLVMNLSGGNQQKVILARWLLANSEILIFDEPTRGIDVGTKAEIYRLMDELIHRGKSIIMVSSELPEILRMSHRILVMHEGQLVKELPRSIATQEMILHYASGGI